MSKMIDPRRRHSWNAIDPKRIPACSSIDGNDRTEKTCPQCGLVKITVHGAEGFPWREWRTKDGQVWQGEATPPCLPPETKPSVVSENAGEVAFS